MLGYDPALSEGALNTPIFRASTFCFPTAEEGERSFKIAYGKSNDASPSLIYTRVNNPNMEIVETRLAHIDEMEQTLVFSSGMGAISSMCMALLKPYDSIMYSEQLYGGTCHLFQEILPRFNIHCISFKEPADIREKAKGLSSLKMIFVETPSNPTLKMLSVREIADIREEIDPTIVLAVDNTFAGPIFSQPQKHGADLIVYSLSKFVGGHSDLIAGSVSGCKKLMTTIREYRTILGNIPDPNVCWLIQRSLETLRLRMERQQETASKIIKTLLKHDNVTRVYYPGLATYISEKIDHYDRKQGEIYQQEYTGGGSIISFCVKGGRTEAFSVLNSVKKFQLAVSLGAVESLIQHPASMTHSNLSKENQLAIGIDDTLIRCSIGLEEPQELIDDLSMALSSYNIKNTSMKKTIVDDEYVVY